MRSPDACFDSIPHATGTLTRLAYGYLKANGLDPRPLLKKANLTLHQIEDASHRLSVSNQIKFLNLAAAELGLRTRSSVGHTKHRGRCVHKRLLDNHLGVKHAHRSGRMAARKAWFDLSKAAKNLFLDAKLS